MTFSSVRLTEEQRQQLLDLLYRRFKKMTDRALLELERLTRHPADLAGYQPTGLAVPTTEVTKAKTENSDDVIEAVFSTPVSRREFFAYSSSGLLALLFGVSGVGWFRSNESVEALSDTLTGVNADANALRGSMEELRTAAYNCNLVIAELLSSYPQTANSIAQLKDSIDKTHSLYSQLDETEINIAEVLRFLSEAAAAIPGYGDFSQPITAVLDILRNTPDTLFMAENAMANLNLWFSEGQGIDQRLLSPTQMIFETVTDTLTLQVETLQDKLNGM